MPVNITQGNSAQFIAEFVDASGNITVPVGANLTIVYPLNTLTTASTVIAMTLSNSVFTATWSSAVSAYGSATWSVTATGASVAAASGQLNIIDP